MSLKYNSPEFLKVVATSKYLKLMSCSQLLEFIESAETRLRRKDYKNLSVISCELKNAVLELNSRQTNKAA